MALLTSALIEYLSHQRPAALALISEASLMYARWLMSKRAMIAVRIQALCARLDSGVHLG